MAENGVIKKLTPAERSFYTAAEVRVVLVGTYIGSKHPHI